MNSEKINSRPEDLTHDEILEIINSEHVMAEQLDIYAAYARHHTARLKQEIEVLDNILKGVDQKLKNLK